MNISAIDGGRIQAMLEQLKAAAARPSTDATSSAADTAGGAPAVNFADMLKQSIDQLNATQVAPQQLGERFAMGDDKVQLSDLMISLQKANIAFQGAVQVRNRLVSAYHDIINMQV